MEIPDNLLCLFTARIDEQRGSYVIDVPEHEVGNGAIDPTGTYRVAILPGGSEPTAPRREAPPADRPESHREPPVDTGDVRTVEIEGLGDQGDGIARVDRGYVVIVPDTEVGEEVTVEIEDIHPNFAIARVVDEEVVE